jgi:hypothetical protein
MQRTTLVVLASTAALLAYSSGPPNAKTGRPGEGTCLDCHSGSSGSADSSQLLGFRPVGYEPDSFYRLTLMVSYAGMARWGFELTAADQSGNPAGQLVVLDSANTHYGSSGAWDYLKQTSAGSHPGQPGQSSWQLGWRAPGRSTGAVTFYWCCNAANNNGASTGDTIIRDSLVVTEAVGIGSTPEHERFRWHYASPAANRVVIEYEGEAGEPVRVWSAEGRLVRTLRPSAGAGLLMVEWDGRDESGQAVPEAGYFIRLGGSVSRVIRVQLVR